MRTVNEIEIRAPWKAVFKAAAEVGEWPRLLAHYRWVKVGPGRSRREVVMAASRDGIPCRWTAEQWLQPERRRIRYLHTRSNFTQGMEVWWILRPIGRNRTAVLLTHDLPAEPGLLGWFRQAVVGDFFVHNIAGKTLAGLKRHLEAP
jgi:aromatase